MTKSIYDLSAYQMYRLQSLHPVFSEDWKQVIQELVLPLDKESQNVVYQRILLPVGIYFDEKNKKFDYKKAPRLNDFLAAQTASHPQIKKIIQKIQELISPPPFFFLTMKIKNRTTLKKLTLKVMPIK